jgi:hypothetical protein
LKWEDVGKEKKSPEFRFLLSTFKAALDISHDDNAPLADQIISAVGAL